MHASSDWHGHRILKLHCTLGLRCEHRRLGVGVTLSPSPDQDQEKHKVAKLPFGQLCDMGRGACNAPVCLVFCEMALTGRARVCMQG